MFKDLGISEADWNSTPQSVKTVLSALQHQARLLEIRFAAYEQKKRDFQAMVERSGESQEMGKALLAETKEVFRLWHQVTAGVLRGRKFRRFIASCRTHPDGGDHVTTTGARGA